MINNNINNNSNNNNYQQVPQREKFLKAINKICPRNSSEILDLLMTLSPKERSLCYFNAEYLNKKIVEANGALDAVCNDDDTTVSKSIISADLTPASTPPTMRSLEPMVPRSNYTDVPAVVGVHNSEYKEIEEFMDTLKNKPVHEQKQKLGDRLFPKVKVNIFFLIGMNRAFK
jgi:polyadenylate-binding protein